MRSFFTTVLGALLLGACSTVPTTTGAAPGVVSAADPRAAEAGAASDTSATNPNIVRIC